MTTPPKQGRIMKHVLENVIQDEPGSPLSLALEQHGCQSILDVLALTSWEIETLQFTDGSKPKRTLTRGCRCHVVALQAFVLSLHPSPDSISTNDWLALTEEQFSTFQRTSYYMLLRQQAPRPEPPPDTTKNGEQSPISGALDVYESFDVDAFEATMTCSKEPACCIDEEAPTANDDLTLKALENAILFFDNFCLEDDFELHSLDEPNVPNEEFGYVPPCDKPSTTNKEAHEPNHASAMEDTAVCIEYPDRTKFVSSMNHERYEELAEDWYADY